MNLQKIKHRDILYDKFLDELYHIMEKVERSFGQIVRRFFEPRQEMKRMLFRSIWFPLISSMCAIAVVEIMRSVVSWVENNNLELVQQYVFWLALVAFTWISARWLLKNFWFPEIRPKWLNILSKKYLSKYIEFDNNKIEVYGTWKLIAIFEKWITSRVEIFGMFFQDFVRNLTRIIFILIYVFTLNIAYWIWFTTLVFLVVFVYVIAQHKANVYRRRRRKSYIAYMGDFVKIIMSKFEILQSWKIKLEFWKFNQHFDDRYEANKWTQTMHFISESFSVFLIDALRILAILSVVFGVVFWKIDLGAFVALISILVMLDNITWDIGRFYIDLTAKYISLEKMRDLIDEVPVIKWYKEWNTFTYKQWKIDVKDITYAYDETNVFSNFSLNIQWGKKTALVGISWSGKSTLVKLIAGYLRPDSGSIVIDGQDLSKTSLKSYYKHIWYLTQEPSVFDGTVIENLTYAIDGEVDQQLLDQAVKNAKCKFIYDFADGLQTEIGERGIRLSGGQRQRLAIAKIFLKDPEIIILDEPTSALDSFSEEWITEAMHNLFENRTVIIIAHRLQTVKQADDIILLEDGQVKERWTHDELVASGGEYAKMLELQSWF
mgnify:CR=1 FL=1